MSRKNNNMNLPPVVLLGGGVIALSVARCLSLSGIKVYALDEPSSEVHYSRFCSGIVIRQNEDATENIWLQWLLNEGKKIHNHAVLIACCDEGLLFIANHRAKLEQHFVVMEANDDITISMLDKAKTYELADKLGIPAPKTWQVNTLEELMSISDQVTYPCALKPRESHIFTHHFHGAKMIEVHSKSDMILKFENVQPYKLKMLVTELIPVDNEGYHSYYSYLSENGEPLFHFTKLRLRQYPNLFGLGTYNVSNWNPQVAEAGLRFLQGIGLRGIGTVEFIRDARDGVLKFIECNPRFTGTTELLPRCGLNWPLLVYNRLVGNPLPDVNEYRQGVYIIKPASDYLAFRELHRHGKLSWFQWIRSLMHWQHFYFFKWNDPMPVITRFILFTKRKIQKFRMRLNSNITQKSDQFVPHKSSSAGKC